MRRSLLAAVLMLGWAMPAAAQFDMSVVSPEVHPDGRVTFRLHAPDATAVTVVAVENHAPAPMTKDADGVWSVTIGPLGPAIYSYAFRIGGATVTDPRNPNVKVWLTSNSMVEVPGNPPRATEVQDVPHGTVHHHLYGSTSLDETRGLVVYTPPGYDTAAATRFPVLYLLHGFGDNQGAWTDVGRAHVIADNLIAGGRALPLVIVMPYGHGVPPSRAAGNPPRWNENNERFLADLEKDVIPFVERTYRVETSPDRRAVAGLSMGGGQTLLLAMKRQDLFRWAGAFSAGVPEGDPNEVFTEAARDPDTYNTRQRLLWIGCGKDDFLFDANQRLNAWLTKTGIRHEYVVTEGGHTWLVWRDYLESLLPKLFRDKEMSAPTGGAQPGLE